MIPLIDFILSNEFFEEIPEVELFNFKIEKINDTIEMSFKHTYSLNVYIYENNSFYYLSFYKEMLLKQFGNEIEDKIIRRHKFFKKMILTKTNYSFIDDINTIHTISIYSDEGIQILKQWINKYENIIKNINPRLLTIELSAGIDTRVLSYFWRNLPYTYDVYTKNDPGEINEAINVIDYINENFPAKIRKWVGKKPPQTYYNRITLNGSNIISGLWYVTARKHYYSKIFNCSYHWNKGLHVAKSIVPYYDKEYLKLTGDYPGQIKIVLMKYLCNEKDLNKLPIRSFERKPIDIDTFDESEILEKLYK